MHRKFLLLTLAGVLIAGCSHSPKDISQLKDASPADSMMYYFGEMQASNYWLDAQTDTMLQSEKARAEFISGLKAAMKMDADDSAYNKGLQLGLRLALRLREFEQRYGAKFSEELLASSIENFLRNDSCIDLTEAQRGYYRLKDRYELEAANKELGDSKVKLAKRGREMGFEMLSDTLYALDVTPAAKVRRLKEGDRVAVSVSASTIDGKEIVTRQFPDSVTLGEGRVPLVVKEAIFTMTPGQTRQFMTTPRTLLGKRYAVYKLPYDEPIIFTVKAQF